MQVSQASCRGIWIVGFGAVRRFFERDLEVVAEIGAALRAAAPSAAAEQIAEAEHVAEDVGEVAELVEDRRIEARATAGRAAHARVAEAVVGGALLGVGEHAVRFGGFLELLFGALSPGLRSG